MSASSEKGRIACSILERYHSSLYQSMTSPYTVVRICQILYSKRCVDERTLNEVKSKSSVENKRKFLLDTIRSSVSKNHRKLHELATVLDQFNETKSVANKIISDYKQSKAFKLDAKEALMINIIRLTTISRHVLESIFLACEEEDLISAEYRTKAQGHVRCTDLFSAMIQTLLDDKTQPDDCLDTFLCILARNTETIPAAESIAKNFGYELPKYSQNYTRPTDSSIKRYHSDICNDEIKKEKSSKTSEEEIRDLAHSILERHHSSLSQSMTSPDTVVKICQILYSKRCVDESVLDEVESANTSLEDKTEILLASMHVMLSTDHRKLHELATVLNRFKETKSVANNIIIDYNLKIVKKAASEAVEKNVVDLKNAISTTFETVILACERETLISSDFKTDLLDSSTNKTTRCSNLITHIHNLVGVQPAHLDTFLCILHGKDLLASEVTNSVAKSYGYNLPKYERIRGVGGATSVVSSDDNVEEMVPQYDQMSNEDRASDILRTHYSTLSQSLKDPVNIARLLHGENVILEDAFTQVDSAAIKDRNSVLLSLVRRAVHDNHQHLKVFGRVLQQLTAGNERVGQDILNDYNKAISVTNVFSVSHETEDEFTGIKMKFGIMCAKIKRTLETNNVSLEEMKICCKFTYTNLSHQVESCQTIEDVLMFVANKCTLINIRLLKELVEFCNVDEAKQHIQDYQRALDDFSQKMRARFPLNQSLLPDGTPHPLRGETITFVMKWNPEIISLDDIKALLTYAFGSLFENVKVIKMEPTK